MNGKGYFVHESQVIEITGSTHIRFILNNPDLFGVTNEWLIGKFKEHHEPIGWEGQARKEILSYLFTQGWVRVRQKIGKENYWIFQFDEWDKRKEAVERFIEFGETSKSFYSGEKILMTGIVDGYREMRYGQTTEF